MAYEVSSSVPAEGVTPQILYSDHASAFWKGGAINPAGTLIATPSSRHQGSGDSSVNYGFEIVASGSSAWAKSDSIDTGANLPDWIKWVSDSEFFAALSHGYVYNYVSSSSGWAQGDVNINVGTDHDALAYFNADNTQFASHRSFQPWSSSDMAKSSIVKVFQSESSGWSAKSQFTSADRVTSVTFIDDDNLLIGMPGVSNGTIQHIRHDGSSWSSVRSTPGSANSSGLSYFGAAMYYHTASSTTVLQGKNSSGFSQFWIIPSQSDGFLPSVNPHNVAEEIDISHLNAAGLSGIRMGFGANWNIDPTDGSRIVLSSGMQTSTPYDDRVYFALESGSSGWKASNAINPSKDGVGTTTHGFNHDQTSAGGRHYVAWTTSSYTSDSKMMIYAPRSPAVADPDLSESVSVSITAADGGTCSAGGKESAPRASISIPENAILSDTTFTVDTSTSFTPGEQGLGVNGNEALSPIVRLTPHGTKFIKAVTVTFNLIGSAASSCPDNAQLWKRNKVDSSWYPVPTNLYSCSGGTITLSTTQFSDYIVIGGQKVARTKLNNVQLARLENQNKVLPEAINITGSSEDYITTIGDTDAFLVQSGSGFTAPISASAMATYFASAVAATSIDVSENTDNADHRIIFISDTSGDAAGSTLLADDDSLLFNPSTNTLKVGALDVGDGNISNVGVLEADTIQSDADGTGLNVNFDGNTGTNKLTLKDGLADALSITDGSADFMVFNTTAETITFSKNSTFASTTIADLGTVTTADIDGGTMDGVTLGATNVIDVTAINLDGASALGSAAMAQVDLLLIDDGGAGTMKSVTFSNFEDSIFGNVSGDVTIAAGGAATMAAAQTNITSLLATDIKIGEDDETKIDFEDADKINFYVNNVKDLVLEENVLAPGADSEVDLGKTGTRFKDAYVDSVTVTDDVVIGGNLTVQGTTTTIDTTNLLVEDSLIEIARGDGGSRASNAGAGLYISGSVIGHDISLKAAADGGRLKVSGSTAGFDVQVDGDYAINGTSVLTATTLGTGVVNSSLTSLGTIASLVATTADINAGTVDATIGGTTPAAGTFTVLTANDQLVVAAGATITGDTTDEITLDIKGVGSQSVDLLRVRDSDNNEDFKVSHDGITTAASLVASTAKVSDLTDGRVVLAGTSGELEDSGNLTFDGTTLTAAAYAGDGSGLTGVGAAVSATANQDIALQIPFTSGSSTAGAFFIDSGSLSYNPSSNRLILPQLSASSNVHVGALFISGSQVGATAAELSVLDGNYTPSSITLSATDGVVVNDGGVTMQVPVSDFSTYLAGDGLVVESNVLVVNVDDSGIEIDSDIIRLKDDGVSAAKLNSDVAGTGLEQHTDGSIRIAAAAAGDGLSGGAGSALALDLNELSAASVNVAADSIAIVDADDNSSKKESIADLVDATAGAGLAATSGVLAVVNATNGGLSVAADDVKLDMNDLAAASVDVSADSIAIIDNDDSSATKKESIADLVSAMTGDGLETASGQLKIVYVEDIATKYRSGSVLQNAQTASLSQEPLENSVQVYLNGMLLVASGSSREVSSSADGVAAIFDYYYTGSVGARKVEFVDAIDDDDVIQIKYIKK